MAIRIIREEGDEILKKKSREVEEINDKILELIQDMLETMHKLNGVGLVVMMQSADINNIKTKGTYCRSFE